MGEMPAIGERIMVLVNPEARIWVDSIVTDLASEWNRELPGYLPGLRGTSFFRARETPASRRKFRTDYGGWHRRCDEGKTWRRLTRLAKSRDGETKEGTKTDG